MAPAEEIVATGRRKTSVARVRMTAGSGKIDINGRSFEEYFPTGPLQNTVLQPLQTVKLANAYDISINATGGGARRVSRFRVRSCRLISICAPISKPMACCDAIRA